MSQISPSSAKAGALAEDTLQGTTAIAAYIGKTKRQTFHLLENLRLPAFKLGNAWHMRKSTYAAFVERKEAEAMAHLPAALSRPPARIAA